MARLLHADRKSTVTQITTGYNQVLQRSISEHTTCQTLKQVGYTSQLRTENWSCSSHRLTQIEDWKNAALTSAGTFGWQDLILAYNMKQWIFPALY